MKQKAGSTLSSKQHMDKRNQPLKRLNFIGLTIIKIHRKQYRLQGHVIISEPMGDSCGVLTFISPFTLIQAPFHKKH
jgi:hypothetical protein